jgi:hypothetical protein
LPVIGFVLRVSSTSTVASTFSFEVFSRLFNGLSVPVDDVGDVDDFSEWESNGFSSVSTSVR